jgi:hypothetical protein
VSTETTPFTQVETVEFEGMTWALVYDLVQWLKEMAGDEAFEESHRETFVFVATQLTRLVTK